MNGKVKLKICGMRDEANIREIAALQPHYMGFIFFAGSPRYVGDDFKIVDLPEGTERVGVFVNEKVEIIKDKATKHKLTHIQLHGKESVLDCEDIRRSGLKVIKAFSIDETFEFAATVPYEDVADFFLFDTKGKYHGGNGKVFNWEILQSYNEKVPFFLSGGLSPENVEQIKFLKRMNLHALDVNSGAEVYPGFKSTEKIKRIMEVLDY